MSWVLGIDIGGTGSRAVLAPVDPTSAGSPEELAHVVRDRMQDRMDDLVRDRIPLIG